MGEKIKSASSYNLGKISASSFNTEEEMPLEPTSQAAQPSTKVTVEIPFELLERIRDYAHWEGMTQKEAVLYALERFFEDNKAKSRPEIVKKREAIRMSIDRRRSLKQR